MPSDKLSTIIAALSEVDQDSTVPRNIKEKIQKTIENLKGESDLSIKVDKALQELDEIADDINLQAYTRTQIWNLVSMLEKF